MAGRIAAPLELTTERRQDLTALSGEFNAAKAGGAGADYLAGGRWRERERDCATALHMAQDRQHVAQALAEADAAASTAER